MDEIKLRKWKENFEQEVNNLQIEYNAFFQNKPLQDIFIISIDESNEWELQLNEQLPTELKTRLVQIFLAAKPEDSI